MKNLRGQHVIYTDELGAQHSAIVTEDWSQSVVADTDAQATPLCKPINLAYVDMTDGSRDSYGQQIIRKSSIGHRSCYGECHGNFWTLRNYS